MTCSKRFTNSYRYLSVECRNNTTTYKKKSMEVRELLEEEIMVVWTQDERKDDADWVK